MSQPTIRPATDDDVEAIAQLADRKRARYAAYQPTFWRPAPDALFQHRRYLAELVESDQAITLVSQGSQALVGFVIAQLVPSPPVYAPGGPSCFVDDFVVDDDLWLTLGTELLRAALDEGTRRGAVQAVVVTGARDEPKRAALRACGLDVVSEWWTAAWPPAG